MDLIYHVQTADKQDKGCKGFSKQMFAPAVQRTPFAPTKTKRGKVLTGLKVQHVSAEITEAINECL